MKHLLLLLAFSWNVTAGVSGPPVPSQGGSSGKFLTTNGSAMSWGTVAASATPALDNLASTAVNANIVPGVDNNVDLGTSAKRFETLYVKTSIISVAGGIMIDLNGTTMYRGTGDAALSWGSMILYDGGVHTSVDWNNHTLNDTTGTITLSYGSGTVALANGLTFSNAGYRGSSTVSAGSATKTVTAAGCSATSLPIVTLTTNDATAVLKNVVPGSGSFVVNLTANATGITAFQWVCLN